MKEGYLEDDVEGDENATEDSLGDSESLDHRLISKKNTKVLVWKYFGFKADENGRPALQKHQNVDYATKR